MAGGRALGSLPAAGTFLLKVTREAARSPLLPLFPVCPFTPGSQAGGEAGGQEPAWVSAPKGRPPSQTPAPHGVAGVR